MKKLIMSIVLTLGVSGAAGAPVWSTTSGDLQAHLATGPYQDRVRLEVSGGDAEMILLRLGVDPGSIERTGDGASAPLTPGQRTSLARLRSVPGY